MNNIFKLANKEGITALSLDSDSIRKWIIDIIQNNNRDYEEKSVNKILL